MHWSDQSEDELAQELGCAIWSTALDAKKLWQAIVKTHKIDCVNNVDEVKEPAAKKSYQNICQGAYETLRHYSKRFHETYCNNESMGTQE
jgi:hypothetical protein